MNDHLKTKAELIVELESLRKRGAEETPARQKSEAEAIWEGQERYSGLLQNLEAGIVVHAPDTSIIMNNPRASLLLGLSDEQLKGKEAIDPAWKFVSEDNTPLPLEDYPINRLVTEKCAMPARILGIHRPNTHDLVWVRVNGFPIYDTRGGIAEIVICFFDITQRKQTEDELRESEEKLSTLFGAMTEMVVLHELVFNEEEEAVNYRITDCNHAFTKVTGIKRENAIGKLATEVYKTESAPYLDEFSKVAITREPYEYTSYYAPMDKHFSISVVSPQKNQFATITTDVTALQQIQKVISDKNKELENFLYVSSHDLRTPLVNVQGFSHRLQKQIGSIKTLISECSLEPEVEEKIKSIVEENIPKTLDFIFTNVTKMDTLINALLEISRTGRVKMTINKIDINQLIQKIVSSLNFQIVELSVQVKTQEMPDCYGDESLLNQLFTNIIVNAIKYRNSERPLVLEISSETKYNKVIYSFKDNGMGIEPGHLEKIWDVFYRVDSASPEAGDGIGLSISKKIVDKHKGAIWASSEIGKGSVFSIELLTEAYSE
ncbi:MAG: PAS domain-containing sensor histidine kinase [Candidatus Marinimicrobia bacterium]|nr:PAS domain-containing sensor histidine kinase [Candidatus Neomarinimicrobiota bacterium]